MRATGNTWHPAMGRYDGVVHQVDDGVAHQVAPDFGHFPAGARPH